MAEGQAPSPLQQKNLPTELWKGIFHRVTHVPGTNEFTTDPFAHLKFPCTIQKITANIYIDELKVILDTRLKMILVCKTWYNLGIADLYSHLWFNPTSSRSKSLHLIATNKQSLLSNVRRLTVSAPIDRLKWPDQETLLKRMQEAVAIISSLPQLRILQVSPELAVMLPLTKLASTLEVATISNWPGNARIPDMIYPMYATAWESVHFLSLDVTIFHKGMLKSQVNFRFVTHFALVAHHHPVQFEDMDWETLGRILGNWAFPYLRTVVIKHVDWPTMSTFCRRHSDTLQSLYLEYTIVASAGVSDWHTKSLVLPKLQVLKLDACNDLFPYFNLEVNELRFLEFRSYRSVWSDLLRIFDIPSRSLALESCRIFGYFHRIAYGSAILLLEQPSITSQLAALRKRGVAIEIHLYNCNTACQGECCSS